MKYIGTNLDKCSKWTSKLFLILIIIAGIIIGSFMQKPLIECKWTHFISVESNSVFSDIKNTFFIMLFYIFCAFIVGSSALGQPLAYLVLLHVGSVIGSFAFLMYNYYGNSAFFSILITFLPKAIAISVVIVLAIVTAFRSSATLFYAYRYGDVRDGRELDIKLYCIRFIVLILLSFIFSGAVGACDYLYLRICML